MIVANTVYSERTTTYFNRQNNQQNSSENVHDVAVRMGERGQFWWVYLSRILIRLIPRTNPVLAVKLYDLLIKT